ncbi:probable 3-hydroxyisobutyrate dehydrogenase, mitochondrial isoform X1 [Daucus carota subsp. sativus]|uniref:probable 3-hydroxyisobutyrate dehydrogenase, mitochondrial isoform X1 n=1 Tax=Daucus carota subsp. sativus TaxID=79200 RepID=UPI0030829F42
MTIYRVRSKLLSICNVISSSSFARFSTSSHIPPLLQRIGFVGLGNMGARMANNLIKAGYDVAVHDVNPNAMKLFSDRGILTKESPFEVTEASDVVITMLPSPKHVRFSSIQVLDVYEGPNGLLQGGKQSRPWLFIDSSTIDPQTSRKVSEAVSDCSMEDKKVSMLDAPVSGGVMAAETATLTFMVGGSEEAYLAAKTLFLSMGKNTVYCGPTGTGSAAKICNNLAMGVSMLGVSEAFVLGQSLGIPADTLTKIINSSSARCWSSDSYNPVPGVMEGVPASRKYDGGFSSKLMAKDLKLAAASAQESGLKCPLTQQAETIFTELCDDGHAMKDFSCVFRHYYSGKDEL